MYTYQDIKAKPWMSPSEAWRAPEFTMLNVEEQSMLRWMAREYCDGSGAIIDAGCFRGGSTVCFAQGLREAKRTTRIQTYDLFLAGPYEALKLGYAVGDSFRHLFDQHIRPYQEIVDVHEGDFSKAIWDETPVELLFIDLAKTAALNDHVMRLFFRNLIPGKSIIVHQDYLWKHLPWIHISMERLIDHFVILSNTGYNSVVFGLTSSIGEDEIEMATWNRIAPIDRVALMDRAISRWSGEQRDYLISAKHSFDLSSNS